MTTNRTPIKDRKRWKYPTLDDEDRPYSIEDWRRHRDQIMEYEARNGKRPVEWWLYEHGMERPYHHEAATLYEMGELRPDELEYKMEFWLEHFEKAMSPHFAIVHPVSMGSDPRDKRTGSTLTKGLDAQRQHLEWAGIPQNLLTRWHAERKAEQ
jgi:hypothetical protein